MSNSAIDPTLYKRLQANSKNWQKMLDILTEEGMNEEDAEKLLKMLFEYEEDENE